MHDLRLVGVHEDGLHLLLSDGDGGRYRVPLDDSLRAAVRRDRPHLGQLQIEIEGGMRPREVQALIRSGLSTQEVAERAGWTPEKVRRYEGPILAEREYVAGLAQQVRMRDRHAGHASLVQRVNERLRGRGVDPTVAEWDAGRNEDGQWQVRLLFPAGGRERTANWWFDLEGRSVVPADDEARWLSEDSEVAGPIPHGQAFGGASKVYDVEAEGGIDHVRSRDRRADEIEVALRASSTRRRRGTRRNQPTLTAVDDAPREDALPLERIAFDPQTSAPPPAARGVHPLDVEPELPIEAASSAIDDEANAPAVSVVEDADPAVETEAETEPEAAVETEAETDTGLDTDVEAQDAAADPEAQPAREAPSGPSGPSRRAGRRSVPSWDDVMFGPGGAGS